MPSACRSIRRAEAWRYFPCRLRLQRRSCRENSGFRRESTRGNSRRNPLLPARVRDMNANPWCHCSKANTRSKLQSHVENVGLEVAIQVGSEIDFTRKVNRTAETQRL